MPLDCYNLTDFRRQDLLFQIEEYELDEIEDLLLTYKKTTGLYITLHGDRRLHHDHVKLLSSLICDSLSAIADKNRINIRQGLLAKLILANDGLLMIGD